MSYILKACKVSGEKCWVAHIQNSEMKFAFLKSEWTDERSALGWRESNFKSGEFYVLNEHYSRRYYFVSNNEDGLFAKEVTLDEVKKKLSDRESPFQHKEASFIKFSLQKNAPKGVVWITYYDPVEEKYTLQENENFFLISGKFKVSQNKFMRNFSKKEIFTHNIKEVNELLISKNDGKIQIIFEDGSEIDTLHVTLYESDLKIYA